MPSQAKIVTRSATVTTVNADVIPKGSGLTNAELDSNFLNLRNQTFGITEGANTADVGGGDTITFAAGSGISMGLSGRTLTITNTGGAGGGGAASTGNITFANSIISTSVVNGNIQIDPNGSGMVEVVGHFNISQDNSGGGGIGSIARFQEVGIDFNHNGNDTNYFKVWGPYGQQAGYNPVLECGTDDDDNGQLATNGFVKIMNLKYPTVDGTNGQVLATNGAGTLAFITPSGGGGGGAVNTGTILFSGNTISTVNTNEDIVLDPAGTGNIQVRGNIDLNGYAIKDDGGTGDVTIKDNLRLDRSGGAAIATQNNQNLKLQAGISTPAYIQLETSTPKDIKMNFVGSGRLDFLDPNATITSTTIGANGAASALTANPVGYLKIKIAGTEYQIPYYNLST